MGKVIVLGSLNADISIACDKMPQNGETINGYGFFLNPGGKGGNQAIACSRQHTSTYMIANVGNDSFKNLVINELKNSNVCIDYVQECNAPTGIAMIIRHDQDNRIILNNGANHMITPLQVEIALDKLAVKDDIFLTQLENNISSVIAGLKKAKFMEMYTVFNPAPALPIPLDVYNLVDLIIVNQSECELITGIYPNEKSKLDQVFSIFETRGCDVIITLGSEGSVAMIQGNRYVQHAYKVDVKDTTGAGDTFVGALCAMLAQGKTIQKALIFASAASALAVMKDGAQVAIPTKEEVDAFKSNKGNRQIKEAKYDKSYI